MALLHYLRPVNGFRYLKGMLSASVHAQAITQANKMLRMLYCNKSVCEIFLRCKFFDAWGQKFDSPFFLRLNHRIYLSPQ